MNTEKRNLIEMNNFKYFALIDLKYNCINLYGNVKINNSYFYGNPLCKNSLIYYNGKNINNIDIINSYFDGVYSNNCLTIIDSIKSNIYSSIFERGGGYINGGYIKV